MSQLNRRNALTALAGLPALAVPAVAIAVVQTPDPIFARIAAHRAVLKSFDLTFDRLDDAQTAAEETRADDKPRVVVGERREIHTSVKTLKDGTTVFRHKWGKKTGEFYYASNVADIERNAPKGPEPKREAWIAERVALLEADAAEIAKAKEECGLAAIERERDFALNYVDQLAWALIDNPPTTTAGAAALLAYAVEYVHNGGEWPDRDLRDYGEPDRKDWFEEWDVALHKSLARVLSTVATVQS
jgi:hypothetical protein